MQIDNIFSEHTSEIPLSIIFISLVISAEMLKVKKNKKIKKETPRLYFTETRVDNNKREISILSLFVYRDSIKFLWTVIDDWQFYINRVVSGCIVISANN